MAGRTKQRSRVVTLSVVLALVVSYASAWGDSQAAIQKLTGARTRVVWVQDNDKGRDVFARRSKLRLMGLDTDDGRGERAILGEPSNYHKPLITPKGDRVVFSDLVAKKVFVVNWDGSGLREVVAGDLGDVWADPDTGTEWAYVQTRSGDKTSPIRRYRIDEPGEGELVWNQTAVSLDNFQLSADGTRAGGLFPWADGGIAELPNKTWKRLGGGCWTSFSPDNSYLFWIFDGSHRNVYLHGLGNRRRIGLDAAPGVDGWEVYHPRWSNHVNFIAMTGPYADGEMGRNNIGAGGAGVEVYIGKFSGELASIEEWARVTYNDRADFYPDVWIDGGEKSSVASSVMRATQEKRRQEAEMLARLTALPEKEYQAWPGDQRGLVFLWENGSQTNRIGSAGVEAGRTCRVTPRGRAIYGRYHEMDLAGGAFLADDVDGALLAACKQSNQLSIEAVLTPANISQGGPARIVTFSNDAGSRNFTLGQTREQLILRLRTPITGDNGIGPEAQLCRVAAGRTYHVIVSYFPDRLLCYVNGKSVPLDAGVKGDFSNWSLHHLLFGDEFSGERDWAGTLEGVAIYNRVIGPAEAEQKFGLYSAKLAQRKAAERLTVRARLVATSPMPDPRSLGLYRRCLAVHAYEVSKVIRGNCDAGKIAVAHWAILDMKAVPGFQNRKVGSVYDLVLERFSDHPELDGERRVEGIEDLDLPVYYDVQR